MKSVFLDTSYVVAIEIEDDQGHAEATRHWSRIRGIGPLRFVTTSFIFDEVVTFLSSRGRRDKAIEIGNYLLPSPTVHFIEVDRPLFNEGWAYFRQHDDKQYSLTDCISFVLMRQLGITSAFTFDHHFRQAGFDVES